MVNLCPTVRSIYDSAITLLLYIRLQCAVNTQDEHRQHSKEREDIIH